MRQLSDKEQVEWIWKNCHVTYWNQFPEYPIEHNPHANKNSRECIESRMLGVKKEDK